MSRWDARGNSLSNSIVWILVIIASVTCMLWIFNTLDPRTSTELDLVHHDLDNLQLKFSEACASASYSSKYNPLIEDGNLTIDGGQVCVETATLDMCTYSVCSTDKQLLLDITTATNITIVKYNNGTYKINTE